MMSELTTAMAAAIGRAPARPCGVLIVEDEVLVAKEHARSLERLGYRVIARAATAEQAMEVATNSKPDLILMDVSLRGSVDGIETATEIRKRLDVPIIYLTALSDDQTLRRAMQTHPFGYVIKPFHQRELRCAMEVALHRHRLEAAARDSEAEFRRLSTIDELTGLPNRRGFVELAEQQMKVACRFRQPLVLCFADLDGLKAINDTLGHALGDQAIRAAAGVLKETFRGADIVARLSGDEFAVLAVSTSAAGGDCALRRLARNLAEFNSVARSFRLEISVGVAHHDADVKEGLEALLARADAAMYTQKQLKRSLTPGSMSMPSPR